MSLPITCSQNWAETLLPFDREDIHYLAAPLDDIVDYTYSAAKKINFYRVNLTETGFQKMAELIEQGTEHVKTAVAS